MTTICELGFPPPPPGTSVAALAEECRRRWGRLPALTSLDLYTPAEGRSSDPYVDDGAAPMMVVLAFPSLEALDHAAHDRAFATSIAGLGALACTAMRRIEYPVEGCDAPTPLTAPFSYVVRYFRPADDEILFVRRYVEGHPPLLARLPGIRNVMCDLPLPWHHAGFPPADYMVGNEVVFDSLAAFNAAMASPMRHELRAHYREFPPFSGRNTHFAMERTRIVG